MAAIGKATVTFTESRIHVVATVHIEKTTLNVNIDADYSMNRESLVYGVITAIEMGGALTGEEATTLLAILNSVNDIPFAFRVRVDDDSIVVKDMKCGPFGSPIFSMVAGGNDKEEMQLMTGIVCGKYKMDHNSEQNFPAQSSRPKKK